MKIKEQFLLRQIVNTWVVMPLAEKTLNFDGMLTLNDAGVLLWNKLAQGCNKEQLVKVLTDEYDVSCEEAAQDVDAFVEKLDKFGCLEHEA